MISLVVAGAAGRMGKTILGLAAKDHAFKIKAALEQAKSPALGEEVGALLGQVALGVKITAYTPAVMIPTPGAGSVVFIDFTHPDSTAAHLKACVENKAAYVLGTTGLSDQLVNSLSAAAKIIPIVQSPNMSIGVNLLFKLAELAAKALDESYDIEIAETHHRMKKDAPSGTAMKLLEVLSQARKKNPQNDAIYGREGQVGERPQGQIGVFALRGGDVVGDHVLSFLGDGERIELTHRATSREAFAQGALRAAKFVAGQKPGLYNMSQVLGIV
ncbi:MAG: 4-hydroxy-tetrahydrodipicolinate reductase [Candidatus Omnitrophica bacterium]|nr:4-hydroxy-tetrahydrodipicolinate reductase [Candidatus Omnitrophota bacterium]